LEGICQFVIRLGGHSGGLKLPLYAEPPDDVVTEASPLSFHRCFLSDKPGDRRNVTVIVRYQVIAHSGARTLRLVPEFLSKVHQRNSFMTAKGRNVTVALLIL
jgi:hypothetical protein